MGPNLAPYYVVEMAEYPDGDWVEVYEECRGNNIKTNWFTSFWKKNDMLNTNYVLFLAYHNSFYEQNMFCNLFSFLTELGQ